MIIGKSLTALGGGGLKPEIRVTAKAGALLNLRYKDSSIILQSYQLGSEETQHRFVASVSETAYVVEDVSNNGSVEVLVDTITVFDVNIIYMYLYKDGVEVVPFMYSTTSSDGICKNNGTNIVMQYTRGDGIGDYSSYAEAVAVTTDLIDVSNYSTINLVGKNSVYPRVIRVLHNSTSIVLPTNSVGALREDLQYVGSFAPTENGVFVISFDVSDLSNVYLYVQSLTNIDRGGGETPSITISKIWLE